MARQEIDLTTPQPNGKMGEPTKSAWEKVNDMTLDIFSIINISSINGLAMSWVSPTSISLSEGSLCVQSTSKSIVSNSKKTLNVGGEISQSQWGHIYGYENNGILEFEVSSTAPSAPYFSTARSKSGDPSKRYVGSIRKNSEGAIVRFNHNHNNGNVYYISDINGSGLNVLNGGKSSSSVNVSASAVAPISSRLILGTIENQGSEIAFISTPELGPAGASNILKFCRVGSLIDGEISIDSNRNFNYSFVAASLGSGLSVWVTGYNYER